MKKVLSERLALFRLSKDKRSKLRAILAREMGGLAVVAAEVMKVR